MRRFETFSFNCQAKMNIRDDENSNEQYFAGNID